MLRWRCARPQVRVYNSTGIRATRTACRRRSGCRDASLQPARAFRLLSKSGYTLSTSHACTMPRARRNICRLALPQVSLWCNVPPRGMVHWLRSWMLNLSGVFRSASAYARRSERALHRWTVLALTAFSGAVVSRCSDRVPQSAVAWPYQLRSWTVPGYDARL
jgi:hypothetical protein